MLDIVKEVLTSQFQAALCTLNACIARCPEAAWDAPIGNLKFCQVAFHTLFFADLYLGHDVKSLSRQPFHRAHADYFRNYEELEDRMVQLLYDKPTTLAYVQHVREKSAQAIAAETQESLMTRPGFEWLKFSRAEVYGYNTRHLQHHAAQLSLRLRIDHKIEIPWIGTRWREL